MSLHSNYRGTTANLVVISEQLANVALGRLGLQRQHRLHRVLVRAEPGVGGELCLGPRRSRILHLQRREILHVEVAAIKLLCKIVAIIQEKVPGGASRAEWRSDEQRARQESEVCTFVSWSQNKAMQATHRPRMFTV